MQRQQDVWPHPLSHSQWLIRRYITMNSRAACSSSEHGMGHLSAAGAYRIMGIGARGQTNPIHPGPIRMVRIDLVSWIDPFMYAPTS